MDCVWCPTIVRDQPPVDRNLLSFPARALGLARDGRKVVSLPIGSATDPGGIITQ
jgi:hypothetical protein